MRQASYETYTRAFCAYPPFVRATFFSLHALDCELLQIGDKASRSEQLASIRFQWWRDALASLHKDVRPLLPCLQTELTVHLSSARQHRGTQ